MISDISLKQLFNVLYMLPVEQRCDSQLQHLPLLYFQLCKIHRSKEKKNIVYWANLHASTGVYIFQLYFMLLSCMYHVTTHSQLQYCPGGHSCHHPWLCNLSPQWHIQQRPGALQQQPAHTNEMYW